MMEFVRFDHHPNWGKLKIHVPKHQPVLIHYGFAEKKGAKTIHWAKTMDDEIPNGKYKMFQTNQNQYINH